MNQLPIYVTDNPDNIPSIRMYEGDLATLMAVIGKIETKMATYDKTLSTVCTDMGVLKACLQQPRYQATPYTRPYTTGVQLQCDKPMSPRVSHSLPGPPPGLAHMTQPQTGNRANSDTMRVEIPVSRSFIKSTPPVNNVNSASDQVNSTASTSNSKQNTKVNTNVTGMYHQQGPSTLNWADATTSSPYADYNRYGPLQAYNSENGQSEDDIPFTQVISRRARRIRRRQEESNNVSNSVNNGRRPGARLLVGTSQTAVSSSIIAAKRLEKKVPRVVLYVDNLSKDCSENDLVTFVTSLTVTVFTCYKVVPRHRYGTEPDESRSAFRLCVAKDDLNKVINPTVWPESVVIAEWVHKKESTKRTRLNPDNQLPQNAGVSDASAGEIDNNIAADDNSVDMDTTVIYNDNQTTPASADTATTSTENLNTQHGVN